MLKTRRLNCASLCPVGGRLAAEGGRGMVCHCLLVETAGGLVLVDTGFGTADVAGSRQVFSPILRSIARPALDPCETAIERVRALGYRAEDVRHIVVTHLDVDHAGGSRYDSC